MKTEKRKKCYRIIKLRNKQAAAEAIKFTVTSSEPEGQTACEIGCLSCGS
ncbi:hypothetical protein BN1013_00128 [Candidatus Rubidus massiliensis]|nr:hypothetical protein BN1013_00128 [Candidatus Rubidus massiliensis]